VDRGGKVIEGDSWSMEYAAVGSIDKSICLYRLQSCSNCVALDGSARGIVRK
jgi:hypothetical protein